MKREDFIKIIRLRSVWKIDRRIGDYTLPNQRPLSHYVQHLVESQMELDRLLVAKDGNLYSGTGGEYDGSKAVFSPYTIWIPYRDNEICSDEEQYMRVRNLVREIVG